MSNQIKGSTANSLILRRRVLPVLFGTLLIDMVSFGMVFPIIPILFTDPASPSFLLHGYSTEMRLLLAGAITAVWGIAQFFAAPILGELSDVHGRKKLLLFGVGVVGVSQFLFGLGISVASVMMLFLARAIAGIAAGNVGIAQAAIADITEPKDRAKNFGLIGASLGLGIIIGPLISGWLSGAFENTALPFFVGGILGILNVALVFFLLPETNTQPKAASSFTLGKSIRNIRAAFSDADARRPYLSSFLYFSGLYTFTTAFGIFLVQRFGFSESETGTAFAAVGACTAFTQIVILRVLARRYSEMVMLKYSLPMVAGFTALSAFMPNTALFLAFIPLIAVPHAISQASIPSLISRSVSPERQGTALGINASLLALASTLGPLLMGLASGIVSLHAAFVIGAILMLSAWSVLYLDFSQRRAHRGMSPTPDVTTRRR